MGFLSFVLHFSTPLRPLRPILNLYMSLWRRRQLVVLKLITLSPVLVVMVLREMKMRCMFSITVEPLFHHFRFFLFKLIYFVFLDYFNVQI